MNSEHCIAFASSLRYCKGDAAADGLDSNSVTVCWTRSRLPVATLRTRMYRISLSRALQNGNHRMEAAQFTVPTKKTGNEALERSDAAEPDG